MNDLKKKLKAALFTVLFFSSVFGLFYFVAYHAKESLAVLLVILSVAAVYTIWKFIYEEVL